MVGMVIKPGQANIERAMNYIQVEILRNPIDCKISVKNMKSK